LLTVVYFNNWINFRFFRNDICLDYLVHEGVSLFMLKNNPLVIWYGYNFIAKGFEYFLFNSIPTQLSFTIPCIVINTVYFYSNVKTRYYDIFLNCMLLTIEQGFSMVVNYSFINFLVELCYSRMLQSTLREHNLELTEHLLRHINNSFMVQYSANLVKHV